jgi:hypothetical protein
MDDMTAFDRQIAGEVLLGAGPSEPVDDLAVFDAVIAANRRQGWGFTMFSALKFVTAAAIVALFGGFLLAGVFTTQQGDEVAPAAVSASPTAVDDATQPPDAAPSPMTTDELLSSMVTEEVGPGVYRVANDGVRDLGAAAAIVAGYDDGIWLLRDDEFFRLGGERSHAWPSGVGPEDHVLEVAPDGALWVIPSEMWVNPSKNPDLSDAYPDVRDGAALRSNDGEVWTEQPCPGEGCRGLTVAPDGTVWASWEKAGGWRVGHLGPAGWQGRDGEGRGAMTVTRCGPNRKGEWECGKDGKENIFIGYHRLFPTDAGDLYGAECSRACALFHSGGGDWENLLSDGIGTMAFVFDVGRDGTVWQEGSLVEAGVIAPVLEAGEGLARFADGEWSGWTSDDLPDIRFGVGLDYEFEVAPDGSLWFSLWRSADGTDPGLAQDSWSWWDRRGAVGDGRLLCDGLARFDGQTLDRFLPGQCISMDIAADGSAWVLADEDASTDLYVITPEAVMASG